MFIISLAQAIARIVYGLLTFSICFLFTVTRRGEPFKRSAAKSKLEASVSHQLWSLEDDGANSHTHGFVTTEKGVQLHYLSPRQRVPSPANLIVFLHGFPDSCYLWQKSLLSTSNPNAKLIALDLPGFGGSDNISGYGPDDILNTIAEAIILLKKKHLEASKGQAGKCILVGHDWGGLVCFRLAAETTGILDSIVVMNSFYPPHMAANGKIRIAHCHRQFQQWLQNVLKADHFIRAFKAIQPLCAQLWKLNYTFMFRLPVPLARYFPSVADALIRTCHVLSHRSVPNPSDLSMATSWATSCGPTPLEARSRSPKDSATYGLSVLSRSQTKPPGDWDQRIRLYKENLATDRWTPSGAVAPHAATVAVPVKENINNLDRDSLDSHDRSGAVPHVKEYQRFKCPVRIIFGMLDEALDPRICLNGIEEFFTSSQQVALEDSVVRLSDVGHWSPVSERGIVALGAFLQRAVEGSV